MRSLSVLIFIFIMLPVPAQALLPPEPMAYTCPLDGTKFSQMENVSDRTIDKMLDLRPVSAYGTSYPWPVAKCPNDGLLIYKPDFDSFTPEEIAVLKEYVPTPEYRKMVDEETTYWVIAKLKEKLGEPLDKRWYTLLQATWQAGPDKYEAYARETINAVEALLAAPEGRKEKTIETWNLLLGELYRRVGDFDKARAVFDGLMIQPAFKNHDFYPKVVGYELELIAAGDKSPHKISEIEDPATDKN